jgi:peptidoglycan-N-acetylglucosamine deacetylase
MDRRLFVTGAAALAGAVLAGCARPTGLSGSGSPAASQSPSGSGGTPGSVASASSPAPTPSVSAPPLPTSKGAIPSGQAITQLPVPGPYMAWTIDDGTDPAVVSAYTQMAEQTGNRLTFFLNGNQPAWTMHAQRLRPLVESGQVQLGNHTWSHPDLTTLSASAVQEQLQRNEDFIQSTYGVSSKPFYRPPFGAISGGVRSAAAAIGFTAPTLWYGSLSDSSVLTPDQVSAFADQWFGAGRIVIGHANHPGVIGAMPHLVDLVAQRGLRTVTLRDVFAT